MDLRGLAGNRESVRGLKRSRLGLKSCAFVLEAGQGGVDLSGLDPDPGEVRADSDCKEKTCTVFYFQGIPVIITQNNSRFSGLDGSPGGLLRRIAEGPSGCDGLGCQAGRSGTK